MDNNIGGDAGVTLNDDASDFIATTMLHDHNINDDSTFDFPLLQANHELMRRLSERPNKKCDMDKYRLTFLPESESEKAKICQEFICNCCDKCPVCLKVAHIRRRRSKKMADKEVQTDSLEETCVKVAKKAESCVTPKKMVDDLLKKAPNSDPVKKSPYSSTPLPIRKSKSNRKCKASADSLISVDRPWSDLLFEYVKFMINNKWHEFNESFKQKCRKLFLSAPLLSNEEMQFCREKFGTNFNSETLKRLFTEIVVKNEGKAQSSESVLMSSLKNKKHEKNPNGEASRSKKSWNSPTEEVEGVSKMNVVENAEQNVKSSKDVKTVVVSDPVFKFDCSQDISAIKTDDCPLTPKIVVTRNLLPKNIYSMHLNSQQQSSDHRRVSLKDSKVKQLEREKINDSAQDRNMNDVTEIATSTPFDKFDVFTNRMKRFISSTVPRCYKILPPAVIDSRGRRETANASFLPNRKAFRGDGQHNISLPVKMTKTAILRAQAIKSRWLN